MTAPPTSAVPSQASSPAAQRPLHERALPRSGPAPRTTDKLTGIIVTYKSQDTIGAALASARRCAADQSLSSSGRGFHLLIVDNASPDATRAILARDADFAQVILGDANIGFGRGCNVGLFAATTPYVVFFNPDAELEPAAVREIIDFMDAHPACAIAGPAIVHGGAGSDHAREHVQHVGALATPWDLMGDCIGRYSSLKKRQPVTIGAAPFRTSWVSGAMLVGRTSVLQHLGGFDPRFFLYWEETDLCRRALDAGHEIWAVPTAVVRHIGGVSAKAETPDGPDRIKGCIAKHFYQSRQYYLRKHHGLLPALLTDAWECVFSPLHESARRLAGRPGPSPLLRWKHSKFTLPAPVAPGSVGA